MGLLTEGSPLTWEETRDLADHVREHGITQFINLYHKLKDRQGDFLKWGDEVEYMIVKFDHERKTARLSLRAQEILPILQEPEKNDPESVKSLWRPEYAAYMIEGTPGKPYGGLLSFFNTVETNMKLRREEASTFLKPGEVLMTITSFPRLGCPDFTDPSQKTSPKDGASKSLFFPDGAIYPGHPRFKTLTRNIRMRRTEKIAINMPVYKDENTPSPYVEDFEDLGDDGESAKAALPDHVYMDAMGFGMGCCCLQLTFQACNIQEARTLYDQLTPLCPIMLALTAASPFYRGKICDVDCRWNVISESVDCRTPEERGLVPLKNNRFVIPKSRYDSIDSYLSEHGRHYNDVPLIYDEAIYKRLRDADIDDLLAQHIAHLFIRDTVSLFSERIHQNDNEDSDHFENIQSTNWQTMRFKPPPFNSSIGWRVEFRPCEVQITDMENAAIVCFVVLLTRVILSYQLNFIIPISKVDENMQKAQRRNALREQLFWFRKDILTCVSPPEAASRCKNTSGDIYQPMSINHIINGKEGVFPGLIPLINGYLSGMDVDADTHCTIQQYLKLIQRRASGELKTTAAYLRDYVANHPDYKKDSNISEKINYDLLNHVKDIEKGKILCPELLGISIKSKTQEFIPKAVSKAYESNYSS
ncbi:glutamate--cysteine ligase, putative [Pediculus humanus corporis]|uniref:Glutamate--cysteine ligase n=1 Tax=Pediculus humanus subsp. corporis TaxID=121224 RepID=E0VFW3_PEDHC|nr:glutamate--cysteine ligase, putative [Pediculus humanus corporis]EEB12269.1 glutamate--cysteine ligase, putative [Pediculus humanus corporis]